MPYSDNLYSIVDDESDAEIEHPLYQSHGQNHSSAGPAETAQRWQAHMGEGEVPGADHDAHMDPGYQGAAGNDEDVLSPTDGYFRGNASFSTAPTSSHIPRVPNVWVSDPSLQQGSTADGKAREAYRERLANGGDPLNTPTTTSDEDLPFLGTPTAASSRSGYAHTSTYYSPHARAAHASAAHPYTPSSSSSQPSQQYQPYRPGSSSPSSAAHTYQSASAYAPSAPAAYRSYTPRRPTQGPRVPSPVPSEAPPAYTPSPTSPVSSDYPRNYSTFPSPEGGSRRTGIMGREESQGLLAGRPQSMASPDDEYEEINITPVWRERVRRRMPVFSSRTCRNVLVGVLLFLVALGFLSSFFTAVRDEKERQDNNGSSKPPPSVKQPADGQPSMEYPIFDDKDGFSWGTNTCKGVQVARPTVWFSPSFRTGRGLAIKQDIQDNDHEGRNVRVSGEVIFRRSGPGTPGPSIALDVIVNDDRIQVDYGWDADQQYLLVNVPRSVQWDASPSGPCVRVRMMVWVPEDGTLDALSVETIHLGVKLLDNLSLEVLGQSKLSTTVGPVVAASSGWDDDGLMHRGSPDSFVFNSRYVEVKTTSASISGSWPLYDYLGLQSTSGTIHVGIEPKEELADAPKPAILYIKAFSGDVEFYEPIELAQNAFALSQVEDQALDQTLQRAEKYLPPRDYRVNVQSTSGTIKGSLAFSSACRFHSTSGSTTVDLLPVLDSSLSNDESLKATLETSSTSGTTNVKVFEPMWVDGNTNMYLSLEEKPALPSMPTAPDGLGDGGNEPPLVPIPVGRVGSGDPYKILPEVGNSGPGGVPTITGAKPATGSKREVVTDLNAAANIAAQFEQQAAAQVEKSAVAWRSLVSSHSTTSAGITLHYPRSWEGSVELGTLSGDIVLHGKDIHDRHFDNSFPGVRKTLRAIKGPGGGSKVLASATSGDVKLYIGED